MLGRKLYANDLWKALYSGRYLALFRNFPNHATFTHSPTINFLQRDAINWLGNLSILGIHQIGGLIGLQIFRGLMLGFFGAFVLSILQWRRNPLVLLGLVFFGYGIEQKLLLRTAIFAVPMLTIFIWVWNQYSLRCDSRYLWMIPPTLILWSNLHGSFLVGMVLFLLLGIGEFFDQYFQSKDKKSLSRSLLLVMGITVLLLPIVKPFPAMPVLDEMIPNNLSEQTISKEESTNLQNSSTGNKKFKQRHYLGRPDLLPEINEVISKENDKTTRSSPESTMGILQKHLKSIVFPRQRFRSSEFQSPFEVSEQLMVRINLLIAPLVLIVLWFVGAGSSTWLATGGILILGLSSVRATAYITLALVPLAGMETSRSNCLSGFRAGSRNFVHLASIIALGLLGGNILSLSMTNNIRRLTGNHGHILGVGAQERFSRTMAQNILNNYRDQRFFNSYNSGTFLIWSWWPHKKVFVDSKWSAYHPQFRRYYATTPLPKVLKQRNIHHALSEKNNYWTLFFVRSDEWEVIARNGNMFFYQRKNYVPPE